MNRVLILSDNLCSGGAQRQIVLLAKALQRNGVNVEVLCYARGNFFAHHLEENNILIHWLIRDNYVHRILSVRKFIIKNKYDAVISFLQVANLLNCLSAVGRKKWKVITGERSANKKFFKTFKGKIVVKLQKYSDCIVCNSNNAALMWKSSFPEYSKKIKIIHNFIDCSHINSRYIPRSGNKLHIVIVATYSYLKNPLGVIKALSLLSEREKAQIQISWFGRKEESIGNTKAYDEAENLINENNLNSSMSLNESSRDVYNIMNKADVIGLFSEYEGFPNVICEGMMLGKPIIMSRVSDYKDLVDNSNGFLCDWNNIDSIKDAFISSLKLSINELIDKGEMSKLKINSLLNDEKTFDKWNSIILK
ncbi:glycosyltransferase [Ancylomarina sp.]|uniref:glycosyltransferase n=1 Tax=Ancylomarina sp. TaxID=1970196 RepID=UPI0035655E0A